MQLKPRIGFSVITLFLLMVLVACGTVSTATEPPPTESLSAAEPTTVSHAEAALPDTVPPLPFADNPDPALCGIPQPWNSDDPAWLSGMYDGELVQPTVYLYDSHLRKEVVTAAPHGSQVEVKLSQSNPELDYYFVQLVAADPPNEGWVPAPFLSFEPLTPTMTPALTTVPSGDVSLQPQLANTDINLDDVVTLLPRDAIPAIMPDEVSAIMVSAAEANEAGLSPDIELIGVSINGESHAYPIPFLSRHEIVNATIGGEIVATTW